MKHIFLSGLVTLMISTPAFAEAPIIPVVPASDGTSPQAPKVPANIVTRAVLQSKESSTGSADVLKAMKSSYKPFVIEVEPGINQLIPIAQGHYNRIVTPFDTPFINTVSEATIEVHKNVIYVASSDTYPVTLYISPDIDDESMAISLTLAPKKIPPVEAQLTLNEVALASLPIRTKAKKWEESQPFVDGVVNAMRSIAFGELPEGYSMSKMHKGDAYPTCLQEGMRYNFAEGQYLRGHHYNIAVGVMENATSAHMEVNEYACLDGSIVAVAAWPHTFLEPGQKTELYVIMRDEPKPIVRRKRASLLGAN